MKIFKVLSAWCEKGRKLLYFIKRHKLNVYISSLPSLSQTVVLSFLLCAFFSPPKLFVVSFSRLQSSNMMNHEDSLSRHRGPGGASSCLSWRPHGRTCSAKVTVLWNLADSIIWRAFYVLLTGWFIDTHWLSYGGSNMWHLLLRKHTLRNVSFSFSIRLFTQCQPAYLIIYLTGGARNAKTCESFLPLLNV